MEKKLHFFSINGAFHKRGWLEAAGENLAVKFFEFALAKQSSYVANSIQTAITAMMTASLIPSSWQSRSLRPLSGDDCQFETLRYRQSRSLRPLSGDDCQFETLRYRQSRSLRPLSGDDCQFDTLKLAVTVIQTPEWR